MSGTNASRVTTCTPSCVHTRNDAFPSHPTPIQHKPAIEMSRATTSNPLRIC